MLAQDGEPADRQTAKERTTEDGEKVADVHRHDCQHAVDGIVSNGPCIDNREKMERQSELVLTVGIPHPQ